MTRGRPVLTLVTVTNSAGADLLRIASISTCAVIASRNGLCPSGLVLYGDSAPVDISQAPIVSRQLRSTGPQSSRPMSCIAGRAIESQNKRSSSRACAAEPLARALATIAALIAPALVPESCATVRLRLASSESSTPQVYAPHDPPPCNARPTGLRDAGLRGCARAMEVFIGIRSVRGSPGRRPLE